MKTIFRAKYVLRSYLDQPIKDGYILVEDGVIKDIGKEKSKESADEEYDLGEALIAPSFAVTHAHVGMTALRGIGEGKTLYEWLKQVWDIESKLNYELLREADVVGLGELISSGVTAVLDFYDIQPMVEAVNKIAHKLDVKLGLAFMDKVKYMEEESWKRLKNIDNISKSLKEKGFEVFISPHSLYAVSTEMLRELFKLEGYKYQMHFLENEEELLQIKQVYGNEDPVEILKKVGALSKWLILAHAVLLSKEQIIKLALPNIYVSHCPVSNSRLGSGYARVRDMLSGGVQVTIGTDGPGSSETLDIFDEIKSAIVILRGTTKDVSISIKDIMHMASYVGFKALGIKSGLLEKGYNADFVAYDLTKVYPSWDLVTALGYQSNRFVIKDVVSKGEFLKKDGELTFKDQFEESLKNLQEFIHL